MSAEQTPDIADVRGAIVAGLRKCRHEDAPVPLAQEGNEYHVAAMVLREVAPVLAAAVREALYAARDDLYAGLGPDLIADADIVYGEWLGNRADRITEPVSHEAATSGKEASKA